MSTLKVNSIEPANAGSENFALCRVWCNWNMITTTSIRDSFGVSSITDGGTGQTTLSFSNSFANNDYSVSCGFQRNSRRFTGPYDESSMATTSVLLDTVDVNGTYQDGIISMTGVFGDLA